MAVACIEELLFRGVLQGVVQRAAPGAVAVGFVAALYSIVHFLKPPEHALVHARITWTSGFTQLSQVFWQFQNPMLLLGGFTTLFIVGLVLGLARLRTRSLWMPVGLHAGWIIAKMGFNKIAQRHGETWPWFGPDLLVGAAPVCAVALTGVAVWWWLRHSQSR
jgi:membrane protease YdiL (CAAX protease family)